MAKREYGIYDIGNVIQFYFDYDHYNRFRISLQNGDVVIIAPSGIRDAMNNIIWVQSVTSGEFNQPHEFIQALGKGLEDSGLQV